MKVLTILIALTTGNFTSNVFAVGLSATTNGLYLAVCGFHQNNDVPDEPMQFDDLLLWRPFCETGAVEFYSLSPRYGAKVTLTDTNGDEISKTALGKQFGSKWNKLHGVYMRLEGIKDAQPYPIMTGGSYKDGLGGGRVLPKPDELFEIEKPGVYTLTMEIQMLRLDRRDWSRTLFRFPPVTIKVKKP